MPSCVPGARKQSKEVQDVTLWLVSAVKAFVIYVPAHGSLIIKTILNVTFISKAQQKQ
jgi:hypothetical protein